SPTTAGRLRSRPTTPTPTLTSPARWCGSSAARRRSDTGNATSSSTRVAPGRGSRAPTSSSSSRPTRARGLAGRWNEERRDGTQSGRTWSRPPTGCRGLAGRWNEERRDGTQPGRTCRRPPTGCRGLAGRWNEERRDGTQPGRTCRRPPTECRGLAGAAPMRMLIVGGGGREHALAWKIAQSPRVTALFTAPGNPGIARHAVCVPLAARARGYCREVGPPLVVKADGLAGGKGAIVCRTLADADEAVAECMERAAFGAAGATVVVEEFLSGEEVSFFALANGADALPLAAA